MLTLLIALGVGLGYIVAYHTYGRWLGKRIFEVSKDRVCPSHRLRDDQDYVPTPRFVVFGHHFTSTAATGPIVGPAIAVIWGWLPAILWVFLGSIFMGAVHDFGSLVISLRNNGQTVGEIAGRVLNRRVRLLFLLILFLALTIIIAIFGLVIAAVFRMYPSAIFPCLVQLPIAIMMGLWLHRKGVSLTMPSVIALALMYVSVIYGNAGWLGDINVWLAGRPTVEWVIVLLVYSYIASVLPVWLLLQPRDYINALQLVSSLGLVVVGLIVAGLFHGAPAVNDAAPRSLEIVAPMFQMSPVGAPPLFPFLFITIACGAISGFHCLVSSGTSSKQLNSERDAQFVGAGSMMLEGFLATLVVLACVAGLGLGSKLPVVNGVAHIATGAGTQTGVATTAGASAHYDLRVSGQTYALVRTDAPGALPAMEKPSTGNEVVYQPWPTQTPRFHEEAGLWLPAMTTMPADTTTAQADAAGGATNVASSVAAPLPAAMLVGTAAWHTRYASWGEAGSLGKMVGSFVDGSANFLRAMGIPLGIAVALMGVFVASFAGTTLDSATRLQRYVIQEIAATFVPDHHEAADMSDGKGASGASGAPSAPSLALWQYPFAWLKHPYVATMVAVVVAGAIASLPSPAAAAWTWSSAGGGGLILWPMFGAMNQLLAGLAFVVIIFWLWRRNKPIFFVVLPLCFMLLMPAWAMVYQMFLGDAGKPGWVFQDHPNWPLILIAITTLLLEAWMLVEAALLWPRVRGVLEQQLPQGRRAVHHQQLGVLDGSDQITR